MQKLLFIALLLIVRLPAKSQDMSFDQIPSDNPLQTAHDSALHQLVKSFFSTTKAPGLVVGLSQQGKTRYYSYGYADPATKKMFDSTTIFEIGSITKTFTANLLMQLDEKHILNIHDPVTRYIPESSNDSALKKIILADIASQSSGLPRLPAGFDKTEGYSFMQPYEKYTRDYLYPFLGTLTSITPGQYAYSNLGFGLLSTIMENVTRTPYAGLLDSCIFRPLGMISSYVEPTQAHQDTATGFFNGKPAPYWRFNCLAGAGAVKSNAVDILKYLEAHISPEGTAMANTIRRVTTPVLPAGPGMHICYAWHTLDNLKHRAYWHNGGTYGFSTFAAFEPATKTAIVLAANSYGVNSGLDELAVRLLILLTD